MRTLEQLARCKDRFQGMMRQRLREADSRLEQYRLQFRLNSPEHRIREMSQLLTEKEGKLQYLIDAKLKLCKHRLAVYIEKWKGLSPLTKLEQGYVLVTGDDGKRVTAAGQIKEKDRLWLYLADGRVEARAERVIKNRDEIV